MEDTTKILVVGLGEVGKPLYDLLSPHYDVVGVDIAPIDPVDRVDVMHVCYPFQIKDFIGETARYIERFKPSLTVINSTVAVGTTREIAGRTGVAVVNSPVRGKHVRMLAELRKYTKFIGSLDADSGRAAAAHFQRAGLTVKVLSTPEASELAKLTETTYFGLLIAWAQEVERYCDQSTVSYDEVVSIYEEIAYLPSVKFFPGIIGGHCVMPNIEILRAYTDSDILEAIRSSNRMKADRDLRIRQAHDLEAVTA